MEGLTKEILVTIPVTETHKRYLEEQASSGEYHCSIRYKAGKEVEAEDVKRANVIIGNVRPELLHHASGLELFQLNSAGADSYTGPGILPEGAVLANAKGAYGLAVSEHMLALTFSLIRRLPEYGKRQASHQWSPAGNIISVEGSVVLVLGLGDIGGDYARKMKALGAYVIGIRRTEKEKLEYLDEQYTMEQLDEVLDTLTEREQKVLRLRFGMNDGRARTLEEVGKEFDVTRERIRQIEAKALRKLRHPSRSRKLRDYLD